MYFKRFNTLALYIRRDESAPAYRAGQQVLLATEHIESVRQLAACPVYSSVEGTEPVMTPVCVIRMRSGHEWTIGETLDDLGPTL
jgi:hypothetical protein